MKQIRMLEYICPQADTSMPLEHHEVTSYHDVTTGTVKHGSQLVAKFGDHYWNGKVQKPAFQRGPHLIQSLLKCNCGTWFGALNCQTVLVQ